MSNYKYIYERYCPNVSRNVVVEEQVDDNGHIQATCHNYTACQTQHGGCQNTLLQPTDVPARKKNTRLNWDNNTI